eukprot:TRINITY_DN7015_c0_g2_i3.p1 TRINITY_DN7015_c0_g2~~TRINITY_DN7015_c0_g2_i3.p1  ORF type:complete len:524 (-),score=118.82 TRINITY_DN7015_c0_g2_i3:32-1603(-)
MKYAHQFLVDNGRPDWTPIERVRQGSETTLFKAQFVFWTSAEDTELANKSRQFTDSRKINLDHIISGIGNVERVDAGYEQDAERYNTDGNGSITIWRIENFKKQKLPEKEYGVFYAGDSYIVLFQPESDESLFPICYYWLGRYSSQDERGAAALAVKDVARDANHCRVIQGKEPPHFLNLFKGKMVIRTGGVASGFEGLGEVDELADGSPELFHIKGTNERNTRAVQVQGQCSSLCSADCFVLNWEAERKQFLWYGVGSEHIEQEYARTAASFLRSLADGEWTVKDFKEGEEPKQFWKILGGKTGYLNPEELQDTIQDPRLFHCSDASGTFRIEEVHNFTQEDLMMDDIYLLDTYNTVFVWVGPESNQDEKEGSFQMALEYVKTASKYDGRSLDTPVVCTLAGFEPPMFTYWFQGWDAGLCGRDSYDELLEQLGVSADDNNTVVKAISVDMLKRSSSTKTYAYSELRKDRNQKLPYGVQAGNLEMHLSDVEFKVLFKMTKNEWTKGDIPQWKREKIKQALHLF